MINGNADFEDVPIETLIREFRFKTDFTQIETVEEIKDKFIDYVSKNTDSSSNDEFVKKSLKSFKQDLIFDIDSKEPIVKVFAINEEVYAFITGVNEDFNEFILRYILDAKKQ